MPEMIRAIARVPRSPDRAKAAALHYGNLGGALKERDQSATEVQQLANKAGMLQLNSPIAGRVITPRTQDRLGSYLTEGSELLEVADLSAMRARIFISEYDLRRIRLDALVRIQVEGLLQKWDARAVSLAARPTEMDPELSGEAKLKGLNPPHFYLVELRIENPQEFLKPGMAGTARVYGRRRSLAALGGETILNFWARKLW